MRHVLSFALVISSPALAKDEEAFDPASVSVTDAIDCHIDARTYNGFALNVSGEDGVAAQLGWTKVEGGNPFLTEYELPEPIAVTGNWITRRIAFSSNAVLALLDEPDPNVVAKPEDIVNEMDPEPLIEELAASDKATREEMEGESTSANFLASACWWT